MAPLTSVFTTARLIHRWAGAALAVLFILVASTGTLLVWKDTYVGFDFPQSAQPFGRDVAEATRIALATEHQFGVGQVSRIDFGDQNFGLSKIYLQDGSVAYIAANGNVLGIWDANERVEDWLLDLHHRLLSGRVGLYVVGAMGMAIIVLIVAGLIAFWPMRRGFSLRPLPKSTHRADLLRAHRNTGLLICLPALVFVLTGVVLTFPETARSIAMAPYQNDDSYGENFGEGVDDLTGSAQAAWPAAIARAQSVFPKAEITGLVWPLGTGIKKIELRNTGEWSELGGSSVHIAEADGYMELRIEASTLPLGERLFKLATPIHRSKLGGLTYKILQTLLGISLIYLSGMGLIAFFKSRKR